MIDSRWVLLAGIAFMVVVKVVISRTYTWYRLLGWLVVLGTLLTIITFYYGLSTPNYAVFGGGILFVIGTFGAFLDWSYKEDVESKWEP